MITVRDTLTLAYTKLRTRKIRLAVTIVVSGLLFTGLVGASIVVRGVFASVQSFNNERFGSRFIVSAYAQDSTNIMDDAGVMNRATDLFKAAVTAKKADAKKLGIDYDPSTDQQPTMDIDNGSGKVKNLNPSSPYAIQAVQEYYAAHPLVGTTELTKLAQPFGATATYESKAMPPTDNTSLQVLKNGKESYDQVHTQQNISGPPSGLNSFLISWSAMSGNLMKPFMLPGQNLDAQADGTIPIVVPFDAAEQLLGLTSLSSSASSHDRLQRIQTIRDKAPTIRFSVCYRNSTSTSLLSDAISTQQAIDQNKNNKDYQKPDLIYGLPTSACGPVPIARDVRTADDKAQATKHDQFDRDFGKPDAVQQTMTFRVVGVSPSFATTGAVGIGQLVSSLVTSSLGSGWYTPIEYTQTNPLVSSIFTSNSMYEAPSTYYAEFATADNARTFIDKNDCQPDFSNQTNPFTKCIAAGKPFSVSSYGSNSLALDSALKIFNRVFNDVALVVALIGAVIMMGTVGRIIADSRRETAVFRAIGAKRLDIAQVYITYTLFLAVLICAFAFVIGALGALFVQGHYGGEATIQALVAYNSQDLTKTFSLFNVNVGDMLHLFGLAIAGGFISTILPLIRNLRRNPIRDMRDEN